MTPSPQQAAYYGFIETDVRSAVVVAVAGAGKTTTLVKGCEFMQGEKFFGAFNKAIAEEIGKRTRALAGMTTGTFHSAGLRAWKRAAPGAQTDALKVSKIFREASDKHLQYRPFEGAVKKLVSLAKQAGMGVLSSASEENWLALVDHFDIEAPPSFAGSHEDAVDLMVKLANRTMKKSVEANESVIDFDDMIFAPIYHGVPFPQYDWVMIDEAQDTNATRRELSLRMLKPGGGRLVAVGDPHQAIYGFTGADSDAISLIRSTVDAVELPLTVTYRCPKSIVAYAQQWVSHIEAAPSAPDGEVIEAKPEDLLKDLAKPGDAVLCRFTAPLVRNAYAFIAEGIPAKIEGKEIGDGLKALANNWKTDSLNQLKTYLQGHEQREVARYLARDQQSRADALSDKVACLMLIIGKLQEQSRGATVQTLNEQIDRLFGEAVGRVVTFSTIHRSKGREWDRVVWLQTPANARARLPWQQEQEVNLNYVAATRAKQSLVLKMEER